MIGSGMLLRVLGLYLFEAFGNWLDKMLKRFDKWLGKHGSQ